VTIGGEFREAFYKARDQQLKFSQLVMAFQQLQQLKQQQQQQQRAYSGVAMSGSGTRTGLGQTAVAQEEEEERLWNQIRLTNGCSVVLGDRPVRLTLLRAWESNSLWGKIKLVIALIYSSFQQPSVEELREWIESIMNDPTNDMLTKSIEDLSKHFPAIKRTIIEERDIYMACKIIQTARIMGQGSQKDGLVRKVVVVVGAGHCPGICKILEGECECDETTGGRISVEEELRKVVETKRYKVARDPNMMALITEVSSMEAVA